MPNSPCPGRSRNAAFDRAAQRIESRMEPAASSCVAGKGVHSSSTIVTSLPSRCWMPTARSGVSAWRVPSICERKVTPSSAMVRRPASDIAW